MAHFADFFSVLFDPVVHPMRMHRSRRVSAVQLKNIFARPTIDAVDPFHS